MIITITILIGMTIVESVATAAPPAIKNNSNDSNNRDNKKK